MQALRNPEEEKTHAKITIIINGRGRPKSRHSFHNALNPKLMHKSSVRDVRIKLSTESAMNEMQRDGHPQSQCYITRTQTLRYIFQWCIFKWMDKWLPGEVQCDHDRVDVIPAVICRRNECRIITWPDSLVFYFNFVWHIQVTLVFYKASIFCRQKGNKDEGEV